MNATPSTLARIISTRPLPVARPVYTTSTGDAPRAPRPGVIRTHAEKVAACEWLRTEGTHVLCNVEADLPGDRSVGTCDCGQWIDTGTFNEREGL